MWGSGKSPSLSPYRIYGPSPGPWSFNWLCRGRSLPIVINRGTAQAGLSAGSSTALRLSSVCYIAAPFPAPVHHKVLDSTGIQSIRLLKSKIKSGFRITGRSEKQAVCVTTNKMPALCLNLYQSDSPHWFQYGFIWNRLKIQNIQCNFITLYVFAIIVEDSRCCIQHTVLQKSTRYG